MGDKLPYSSFSLNERSSFPFFEHAVQHSAERVWLNVCDEKRTSENFKCLHVFLSFALNWGTNNTSLLNKQKSSLQKVVLIGGKKKFLNQYISLAPVVALFTV